MSDTTDNGVQTPGEGGTTTVTSTTNTPAPAQSTATAAKTTATPSDNGGFNVDALTSVLDNLLTKRLSELTPKQPETPAEQPAKTQDGTEVKYTEKELQARINSAIRTRLTEEKERQEKQLESLKAQWLTEISTEFEKQKAAAVDQAIAARDFEAAKKTLQGELGLTDTQLSRLQGKSIDELRADATALGFVKTTDPNTQKKAAPTIATGHGSSRTVSTEVDDIAAAVRDGLRDGI